MLLKTIIGVVVIVLGIFAWRSLAPKQPPTNQPVSQSQQPVTSSTASETNEYFYSKDDISLKHTWPGEGNFSNEETEILLFNESSSSIEVKSFNLEYQVEGKTYPHKSGTWEKFPSKTSWEKIEYIMLSPQHYKGEPLILKPGQKGKLHWHMEFGSQPLDGKQIIQLKLTLLKGNETITIDEQFNRNSGTVVSKDEH